MFSVNAQNKNKTKQNIRNTNLKNLQHVSLNILHSLLYVYKIVFEKKKNNVGYLY